METSACNQLTFNRPQPLSPLSAQLLQCSTQSCQRLPVDEFSSVKSRNSLNSSGAFSSRGRSRAQNRGLRNAAAMLSSENSSPSKCATTRSNGRMRSCETVTQLLITESQKDILERIESPSSAKRVDIPCKPPANAARANRQRRSKDQNRAKREICRTVEICKVIVTEKIIIPTQRIGSMPSLCKDSLTRNRQSEIAASNATPKSTEIEFDLFSEKDNKAIPIRYKRTISQPLPIRQMRESLNDSLSNASRIAAESTLPQMQVHVSNNNPCTNDFHNASQSSVGKNANAETIPASTMSEDQTTPNKTPPLAQRISQPMTGNIENYMKRNDIEGQIYHLVISRDDNGLYGFGLNFLKNGIWVIKVASDSPSAKAGLKFGDCLLKINGIPIFSKSQEYIQNILTKNENISLVIVRPNAGCEALEQVKNTLKSLSSKNVQAFASPSPRQNGNPPLNEDGNRIPSSTYHNYDEVAGKMGNSTNIIASERSHSYEAPPNSFNSDTNSSQSKSEELLSIQKTKPVIKERPKRPNISSMMVATIVTVRGKDSTSTSSTTSSNCPSPTASMTPSQSCTSSFPTGTVDKLCNTQDKNCIDTAHETARNLTANSKTL